MSGHRLKHTVTCVPIPPVANWFTGMNVRERRTFWACFTGWALDAMDVQLYAVVMPTLIGLWAMSQAQAGTLATAALLF